MAERTPSKFERALEYLDYRIIEHFATPDNEAYIDVLTNDNARASFKVRSRETRILVDSIFYEKERGALGAQVRGDVLDQLEAQSRWKGSVRPVSPRIAEKNGAIYIDLGDATWKAVKVFVNETGIGEWRVVDGEEIPVRFRRSRGTRALPLPTRGGSIQDLRPFVRGGDDEFILAVAFLLGAFRPRGPYPLLIITGEQGSAKSTLARWLRSLVDPHDVPLRSPPREERDLMIAAANSHLQAFDNLSSLPVWLADGLCRIATGGGFASRELYSDQDEVILGATRPIIATGIEDVATRADLADRCYNIGLPRIDDSERRTESDLDRLFNQAAPGILGALLDAVAYGLANESRVRVLRLPRMADAARWVVACEPLCPWEPGQYLAVYAGVRDEMLRGGIEGDPVAASIVAFMEMTPSWAGTATELLAALNAATGERRPPRSWPDSARKLGGLVTRAAPLLRSVGIDVSRSERQAKGRLFILSATALTEGANDRHYSHTVTPEAVRESDEGDDSDDNLQDLSVTTVHADDAELAE